MATVQFGYPKHSDPGKPLPNNPDAERALIGAILLDPSAPNATLKAALEEMNGGDLFVAEHRVIFSRLLALSESERPVDLLVLTDELTAAGEIDRAGGAGYIASLIDGVPNISNAIEYARIVRDKSLRRQLIYKMNYVQERAYLGDQSSESLLADLDTFTSRASNVNKSALVAIDNSEFLGMTLDPLEYVIEPLLTAKGRGMVWAPRGAGKTFVTMQLAYAIATGENCFVWHVPTKRRVLYVDGEMHASMLQERMHELVKINGLRMPEKDFFRLITRDLQKGMRPKINSPAGRERIDAHLAKGDVLILDNLSALSPSSDEQETEDWAIIEDWLSELSSRGITTIFVNHAGKSGDQRGTSKREDLLDFVLKLRVPSDHRMKEGLRVEMHLTKIRGRSTKASWSEPFEVRLGTDMDGRPTWLTRQLSDLLKARARKMLEDGMRPQDVSAETGLSRWSVTRLKKKMKSLSVDEVDKDNDSED